MGDERDYVPGSAGWPDQPPGTEDRGKKRTGQEGQIPRGAEIDPDTRGDVADTDTPVRPGGGGEVYPVEGGVSPGERERDVQAGGDAAPKSRGDR
jgi:hypothetical protein